MNPQTKYSDFLKKEYVVRINLNSNRYIKTLNHKMYEFLKEIKEDKHYDDFIKIQNYKRVNSLSVNLINMINRQKTYVMSILTNIKEIFISKINNTEYSSSEIMKVIMYINSIYNSYKHRINRSSIYAINKIQYETFRYIPDRK
jgi:hypothetical protein